MGRYFWQRCQCYAESGGCFRSSERCTASSAVVTKRQQWPILEQPQSATVSCDATSIRYLCADRTQSFAAVSCTACSVSSHDICFSTITIRQLQRSSSCVFPAKDTTTAKCSFRSAQQSVQRIPEGYHEFHSNRSKGKQSASNCSTSAGSRTVNAQEGSRTSKCYATKGATHSS
jgi:hypothetical protein